MGLLKSGDFLDSTRVSNYTFIWHTFLIPITEQEAGKVSWTNDSKTEKKVSTKKVEVFAKERFYGDFKMKLVLAKSGALDWFLFEVQFPVRKSGSSNDGGVYTRKFLSKNFRNFLI